MELLTTACRLFMPGGKFRGSSPGRGRVPGIFLLFHVCCWLLLLGRTPAAAQNVSHEYPLKAVFLLNFAQFTDWPTNAFDRPDSPLVIGVLGHDPFGSVLEDAVRDETVHGRKFVIQRYQHAADIKDCHILFISQSEAAHLDNTLAPLKGRPILTVSDLVGSANRGICVQFITRSNKIHLRISVDSLKEANLVMSSQLLRLADIVPAKPNETAP